MSSSRSHGGEPVSLGAALDVFRMAATRAGAAAGPGAETAADSAANNDYAATRSSRPTAHWPDGPGKVLERIDALTLSEPTWDRDAVFDAVREVAALAWVEYTRIRVVDIPAEFPTDMEAFEDLQYDESSLGPFRQGWVRQLGILADRRHIRELRDSFERNRRAARATEPTPGHALHAYAEAGLRVESERVLEGIILSPVSQLIEAYVGFMLARGAAGWDHDWHPRDGVLEEFGTELEIGRLLSKAFCSGLGYLAVVDGEIAVARRPALHVLGTAGPDGRTTFHYDRGPAIEFADGTGPHFLEGIRFPGWLHRAIVDGALTMRYVRDMEWQDTRLAIYASMPPAAMLDGLDAQVVDVGLGGTTLYRIADMPDHEEPAWYLVVTDPSTGSEKGEFVPREVGVLGSADAAQASAWGISVKDYQSMMLDK